MAFYRLEAKIIAREKRGRSVIAASAYRSGSKIRDERNGRIYDYSRRGKGVIETAVITPDGAPSWAATPATLWNHVEQSEKRKDAQLAREFILAVPPELSAHDQFATASKWARSELVSKGMVAEISLHHTKSGKNPHVHILCTTRTLDGQEFSRKKERDWNDVALLRDQRESWASAVNGALEKAGRPERVDHRSLKARGIDRLPEPKIGSTAMALKRKGIIPDPERFKLVRYVRMLNRVRPWARQIKTQGEVHQIGLGKNWWERSLIFMAGTGKAVRETVLDTWGAMLKSGRSIGQHDPPSKGRGQDMER